ncbi:metallophosphoesterase family protein [Aquibacillus sp. 3ASR75-11]|uniref:Metallophosphoesterase family protein n=1 Tax=Terrihalobacillus insolitus TaxID=2950438 RepID=A0A9X3WSA7_9BACI|nr:metallophosphoesterase [Terrihalobacillus insolitus]MDC3413078.1 metallophosphoesterase family protein [Terrihalobacillus insolitus]MDC3424820.1 metallophosphoesterase family protein [Terrihalobacillus insolitus]
MLLFLSLLIILMCAFIGYLVYMAYHDTIDDHTIYNQALPKEIGNVTLFFISDVHTRYIKETTLNEIKKPIDLVIIGGDLTESKVPLSRVRENLKRLKQLHAPIYFIWGNNDFEVNVESLERILYEEEVTILANKGMHIHKNGASYFLLGLDCCNKREANIEAGLKGNDGEYCIMVTHDPSAFYALDQEHIEKLNFVLSGHTHGGQIRIFGMGPYSRGGYRKYKDTEILTSEGYGFTKLPFRLGTRSECHVITITHQSSETYSEKYGN